MPSKMTAYDNDGNRRHMSLHHSTWEAWRIMAELNRNRKHDYEYRARQFDDSPIVVDVGKSITEMRSVYSSLTDHEFAAWYAGRYKIEGGTKTVLEFLQRKQAQFEEGRREKNAKPVPLCIQLYEPS